MFLTATPITPKSSAKYQWAAWRGVQVLCDAQLPSRATIARVDEHMALRLGGDHDGMFQADGLDLATAIADIRAEMEAKEN
jgi:hypothetical protein